MCLHRINCQSDEPLPVSGTGYKAMRKSWLNDQPIYHYPFKAGIQEKFARIGQWYESKGNYIDDGVVLYPAGFHIFINREDASPWTSCDESDPFVILSVQWRGLLAVGSQQINNKQHATLVVKQIKFLEEVN